MSIYSGDEVFSCEITSAPAPGEDVYKDAYGGDPDAEDEDEDAEDEDDSEEDSDDVEDDFEIEDD